MQLNGEKIRFFVFCVCFWPPLASFNLSRAIYDIFCEMPTLFFYNLYAETDVQIGRDGVYRYEGPETDVQIGRDGVLGA